MMLQRAPEVAPEHCAAEQDNMIFGDLAGDLCNEQLHAGLDQAWSEFARWFTSAVGAVTSNETIRPLALPDPNRPGSESPASVVDPSTTLAVVAHASARHSAAVYVGIVTRGLDGRWRGLMGFFLPNCYTCDPGNERLVARIESLMPRSGRVYGPQDLPQSVRPRGGWFDDRLACAVQLSPPKVRMMPWFAATIDASGDDEVATSSALVRVGPVTTTLTNLIFVDSVPVELPSVATHLGADGVSATTGIGNSGNLQVSLRCGERAQLLALAGGLIRVEPRPQVIRRRLQNVPIGWGVYRTETGGISQCGITRDLRRRVGELLRLGDNSDPPRGEVLIYPVTTAGVTGVLSWSQMIELLDYASRLP